MRGFAARWILLHVLAFGVQSLLYSSYFLAMTWSAWAQHSEAIRVLLNYGVLAALVAAAQGLALASCGFPVPARLWMPVTAGALALGAWFCRAIGEGLFLRLLQLFGSGRGMDYLAVYTTIGIQALMQGALLGAAQGAVLRCRGERSSWILWSASVMGGWLAGQGAAAAIEASQSSIFAMDKVLSLRNSLRQLTSATAFGAVFAAVTLPALRKLLGRPPSS